MLLDWRERCPRFNRGLLRVFPTRGKRQPWPKPRTGGGGSLLYSNYRVQIWKPFLAMLALPEVTPHSARHSYISTLQAVGIEVATVAKLAGHANPVTTLSVYSHATRGGEAAAETLESVPTNRDVRNRPGSGSRGKQALPPMWAKSQPQETEQARQQNAS